MRNAFYGYFLGDSRLVCGRRWVVIVVAVKMV